MIWSLITFSKAGRASHRSNMSSFIASQEKELFGKSGISIKELRTEFYKELAKDSGWKREKVKIFDKMQN